METAVKIAGNPDAWTIVCDDTCPVVKILARLVSSLDRKNTFSFIGMNATSETSNALLAELDRSCWSLLLVDDEGVLWHGPEAIPFILKNLPAGRMAVVAYLIPGTMWLTRQLYMLVSRNKQKISTLKIASQATTNPG